MRPSSIQVLDTRDPSTARDAGGLPRIAAVMYRELRHIAAAHMRRERRGHALCPAALVSEAYLRMVKADHPPYANRRRFLAVASGYMRRVLVDDARRRSACKRGGDAPPIPIEEHRISHERPAALVALEDARSALAVMDPRKARIVDLHYFGGWSQKEIADALGVHENTVARELRLAMAWLHRQMRDAG